MVADMNGAWRLCCNSCVLLMYMGSVAASAQTLQDPTRPPDAIFTPVDQLAVHRDSGLQSLIISPTRRAAIINGQTVELGGKLGDSRLVEVNESYVVLRNAEGRQVLSMFEGVEIKRKGTPPPGADSAAHAAKKNKSVGVRRHRVIPPKRSEGDGR
jgi:MSHA biogenesis protein MshK